MTQLEILTIAIRGLSHEVNMLDAELEMLDGDDADLCLNELEEKSEKLKELKKMKVAIIKNKN